MLAMYIYRGLDTICNFFCSEQIGDKLASITPVDNDSQTSLKEDNLVKVISLSENILKEMAPIKNCPKELDRLAAFIGAFNVRRF
jgi:hypothetical protein